MVQKISWHSLFYRTILLDAVFFNLPKKERQKEQTRFCIYSVKFALAVHTWPQNIAGKIVVPHLSFLLLSFSLSSYYWFLTIEFFTLCTLSKFQENNEIYFFMLSTVGWNSRYLKTTKKDTRIGSRLHRSDCRKHNFLSANR